MRSRWKVGGVSVFVVMAAASLADEAKSETSFKVAVLDWNQSGATCVDTVLAGEHLKVTKSDVVLWINQNDCMDGIFQITLQSTKPVGRCTITTGDKAFVVNKPFILRAGEGAAVRCTIHEAAADVLYKYQIMFWPNVPSRELIDAKRSHELDIGKSS